MRHVTPGALLLVGLTGLLVTSCFALTAGCGSGTPSNLAALPEAQVRQDVAAVVVAWVQAQRVGDDDALEALYHPDYDFNDMSPAEMAEVRVLPETPDTRIDVIRHRFIPVTGHDHQHADSDHHVVRARVTAGGEVTADFVRHLAGGEPAGHTHEHAARHETRAAADQPLPGTVRARGTYDIEWELREQAGKLPIVRQQIITGELSLGDGVSNPLIDEVHVRPDEPEEGEAVGVHGHYAALPPGGVIEVTIGHHQAEAALDAGQFQADIEAPHSAGRYVARVQAYGGSVTSRTAALTTVEEGVTVQ